MKQPLWSRRQLIKASGAAALGATLAPQLSTRVLAAAPPASSITPALIEAA